MVNSIKPMLWVAILFGLLFGGPGKAEQTDLLAGALVHKSALDPADHRQIQQLLDGSDQSIATFQTASADPVDLIFEFPAGLSSPEVLIFHLPEIGSGLPPGRIDLLVSTVSQSVGFSSARTETIDGLKPEVRVKLPPSAAQWVMLRLYPRPNSTSLALAEVQLLGRSGPPESPYEFNQSPTEALALLAGLKGLDLGEDNLSFPSVRPTRQADLSKFSLADFENGALEASGVLQSTDRTAYRTQIDALEQQMRKSIDTTASPKEVGSQLLEWLHQHVLTAGYEEAQTDLSVLLDTGRFNCVSSAVIYAALGQRLGLDVRGIEVPDHAFAILYDGADHQDVETTTSMGFNPRRDRVAAFEELTGYRYIPQSNKTKRREISTAGMVALIHYNHGVEALRDGDYRAALVSNFRALELDPGFNSAVKNALAALGRWSADKAEAQEWEAAAKIAAVGVSLAPKDRGLALRQVSVWQNWALNLAETDGIKPALAVLERAAAEVPDHDFASMQAHLFMQEAENLVAQGAWSEALTASQPDGLNLPQGAMDELSDWRRDLHIRWAQAEIEGGRYASARDVLLSGFAAFPDDRKLPRTLGYLAQEAAEGASSFVEGLNFLVETKAMFPDQRSLARASEAFVGRSIQGASSLPDALERVTAARGLFDDPKLQSKLGGSAYEKFGHPLIDQRAWDDAAEIYAAGRAAFPDSRILKTNARFLIQEWQRDVFAKDGAEGLAALNTRLAVLFPNLAAKRGFGENEVKRQVYDLLDAGDFAGARAAVDAAQLLLAPESAEKLFVQVIDSEARHLWEQGNWAAAAEVFSAGLVRFPKSRHLIQNATYVAQEWTRSAQGQQGAAEVINIMQRLEVLFPGRDKIAEMGVNTLRRSVSDLLKQGDIGAARALVAEALPGLDPDAGEDLAVTLFDGIGQQEMAAQNWAAAMDSYDQGRTLFPEARQMSRNVDYIIQEWLVGAFAGGGAPQMMIAVREMLDRGVTDKQIDKIARSVAGREVETLLGENQPEQALILIEDLSDALSPKTEEKLGTYVYDNWARRIGEGGDWAGALAIYDQGLADFSGSSLLKNNRKWAASQ